MKALQDMQSMLEETAKKIREQGQAAFAAATKEFFEKHPYVEQITWDQYAPHFNDGEPCVFRVREPKLVFEDGIDDELKKTLIKEKYLNSDNEHTSYRLIEGTELDKDFEVISSFIQSDDAENIMKSLFGDDATVTVTKDGAVISGCDHD